MTPYLGRPEADWARRLAMNQLGNGLSEAKQYEDALSVEEANLSTRRRLGAPEDDMLVAQGNLASTYWELGRQEQALQIERDVYSGRLKLNGAEHKMTLIAANNYASTLVVLLRFEEAKSLLRKTMPVARRVLGDGNDLTLKMRWVYAEALYKDPGATLDGLRESVVTFEDAERIARRVFGGEHPLTKEIEGFLQCARAALDARETPPPSSPSGAV